VSDTHAPLADLTAALIAALRVPAVTALATGGVWNSLPQNPAYPAVRVAVRGKPIGPIAGHALWTCEAEIDAFSAYAGDAEVLPIVGAIVGLLNMQPLTVDGWNVVMMSVLAVQEIPDQYLNGAEVKCLQVPVLVRVQRQA
jgi:hypothetical protein